MLQVVSLGRIVQDPALYCSLVGKPVVVPDQYTIHRAVFGTISNQSKPVFLFQKDPSDADAAPAMDSPYFTATIDVQTTAAATVKSMTFTITRSDDPAGKRYTCTGTPHAVWREALKAAWDDFPDRREALILPIGAPTRPTLNGIRLFGLHLREIQEALMALPNAVAAFASATAAHQQQHTGVDSDASPPVSQPAEASGSKASRKRSSGAAPAAVPTDDAVLVSSQPPASAVSGKSRRKPASASAAAVVNVRDSSAEGESATPPPAKRRRASAKPTTGDGAATAPSPAVAAAAAAVVVVCPDCGLSGTPFCATTGRLHEVPPCAVCGLRSAFCPVTGRPHSGAAQRENRQRGEVHLPGAARKSSRKKTAAAAAAAASSEEVAEVTVVGTQEEGGAPPPKKQRKPRAPAAVAVGESGDAAVGGTSAVPTRRSRKAKKEEKADGTTTTTDATPTPAVKEEGKETEGETAAAVAAPEGDVPLFEVAKATLYIYPPLRPPLTTRDHQKAHHLLQENWRAQYGEGPVLPPAVAAVPLAFVPAKRAATAAAATATAAGGRGRRKAGGVKDAMKEEDEAHQDDEEAKDAAVDPQQQQQQPQQQQAETADSSPTASSAPAALPSMVHPLEVTQLASSVAGKRLTRFLLQYTSERSQLDVLRSSNAAATAAAAAAAGGGADGASRKRGVKGKAAVSKGEEEEAGAEGEEVQQQRADAMEKVGTQGAEEHVVKTEAAEVEVAEHAEDEEA